MTTGASGQSSKYVTTSEWIVSVTTSEWIVSVTTSEWIVSVRYITSFNSSLPDRVQSTLPVYAKIIMSLFTPVI